MIGPPQPLAGHHRLDTLRSGVASLDEWLVHRAARNQVSGASRTFLVCDDDVVVAYYSLASSAIAAVAAQGRFRRNMPDPVPVVLLARLAVAQTHQGRGMGRALFQDAVLRVVHAADSIGVRGLLVHAISDDVRNFYLKLGLEASPLEPMTLMATLADLRAAISPMAR